jgi:hypothetical protein
MRRALGLFVIVAGIALATSCSLLYTLEPICKQTCDGGTDGSSDAAVGCTSTCPDMAQQACSDSSKCSGDAPVCSGSACMPCAPPGASTECATYHAPLKVCGPLGGCVECMTKDDCRDTNRTCDTATNTCKPCSANADCSTGACKPGGVCASPGEVAYVNKDLSGCSDLVHMSSPTAPYCQIQMAATLDKASYIVVTGSATSYDALNLTAIASSIGPVTIIGPGRNPAGGGPTVKIAPAIVASAVLVSTNGSAATVTIDGLELTGTASPGIKCQAGTGAASLTVSGSSIHDSGKAGIDSAGCTLVADANVIAGNPGGGIHFAGASTTHTITNNIIHDNSGSGAYGVRLDDSPAGSIFAFNTVVANGPTGDTAAGGMICPATPPAALIQDSIIVGNSHNTTGGTQFAGQCQLQSVVVGTDSTTSGIQKTPAFTSDDHLDVSTPTAQTTNADCCIDKLVAPGTPMADHDVDRTTRPKGSSATPYDIGAHEVQ